MIRSNKSRTGKRAQNSIFLSLSLTVVRREGEVVVEELSELHDHVGEARVGHVVVRVVLLRDVARAGQRRPRVAAAARLVAAVGVGVGQEAAEGGAGRAPVRPAEVVAAPGEGAVAREGVAVGRLVAGSEVAVAGRP